MSSFTSLIPDQLNIAKTCFSNLLPANSACFMPECYRTTCPLFPIRVIKTVRLRVPYIEALLKDPEISSRLKIVMLTRDPRGVMTSRSAMYWCENPGCSDPEIVCRDLDQDLEAAVRLKQQYPGNITTFTVVKFLKLVLVNNNFWTVAVAQVTQWWLAVPEIISSNPVIHKNMHKTRIQKNNICRVNLYRNNYCYETW